LRGDPEGGAEADYVPHPDGYGYASDLVKRLLEKHPRVSLNESIAMWPTASVSDFYFAHPNARYFTLGKIGKDQLTSYSA